MALIVEGKMPTCCGLCCECLGGGSDAYYCNRAKRQISEIAPPYDKRMEWCPILGGMPDRHGRLIDADELISRIKRSLTNHSCIYASQVKPIIYSIESAPTILEASE